MLLGNLELNIIILLKLKNHTENVKNGKLHRKCKYKFWIEKHSTEMKNSIGGFMYDVLEAPKERVNELGDNSKI
jgi:hypothetical protein